MSLQKKNYAKLNIFTALIFFLLIMIIPSIVPLGGKSGYLFSSDNFIQASSASSNSLPVFNNDVEELIDQNKDVSENIAQYLIDGILEGQFFQNSWIPSLQATYYALNILDLIDGLATIDQNSVSKFILGCFNNETAFFEDEYSSLIKYSYKDIVFGYSVVEATAYGILCLDILDEMDSLSPAVQNDIFENFNRAFNLQDGGFCHSVTEDDPEGPLSSSLLLSYLVYSSMEVIGGPHPLSIQKEDAFKNFILNLQNLVLNIHQGGFSDSGYDSHENMESTYFAVKILTKLGDLDGINSGLLSTYIDRMSIWCPYGVYNEYSERSVLDLAHAEYHSTAITLYLDHMLPLSHSQNINDLETYVLSGFSLDDGNWPYYYTSNVSTLRDLYFVLNAYSDSGRNFSQTIKNSIISTLDQYSTEIFIDGQVWFAYHHFSKDYGTLSAVYDKILYLKNVGYLESISPIQKNAIYDWIIDRRIFDSITERWTFSEFPNFTFRSSDYLRNNGNPIELGEFSDNTTYANNYGIGVRQIHHALTILNEINKLGDFNASYNLSSFVDEIRLSQADAEDPIFGSFYPNTRLEFFTESHEIARVNAVSIVTSFYAIETLMIIDDYLSTDYLHDINVYGLKAFLESNFFHHGDHGYFSLDNNQNEDEMAHSSYYCFRISSIYDFWSLDDYSMLTSGWLPKTKNYPTYGNQWRIINPETFAYLILLEDLTTKATNMDLNISQIQNIFRNYLGNNPDSTRFLHLDTRILRILSLMVDPIFSTLQFAVEPQTCVGFSTNYQFLLVGLTEVFSIDSETYNLQATLITKGNERISLEDEVIIDNDLFIINLDGIINQTLYPNFTMLVNLTNGNCLRRNFQFILPCDFYWNIKLDDLELDRKLHHGDIVTYRFGLYASDSPEGTSKKSLVPSNISAEIVDRETQSILLTSRQDEEIEITFDISTSTITYVNIQFNTSLQEDLIELKVYLQDSAFIQDPTIINSDEDPIPFNRIGDQTNAYEIKISAQINHQHADPKVGSTTEVILGIVIPSVCAVAAVMIMKKKKTKTHQNLPKKSSMLSKALSNRKSGSKKRNRGSNVDQAKAQNTPTYLKGAKIDDIPIDNSSRSESINKSYSFTRDQVQVDTLNRSSEVK